MAGPAFVAWRNSLNGYGFRLGRCLLQVKGLPLFISVVLLLSATVTVPDAVLKHGCGGSLCCCRFVEPVFFGGF